MLLLLLLLLNTDLIHHHFVLVDDHDFWPQGACSSGCAVALHPTHSKTICLLCVDTQLCVCVCVCVCVSALAVSRRFGSEDEFEALLRTCRDLCVSLFLQTSSDASLPSQIQVWCGVRVWGGGAMPVPAARVASAV